MRHTHKTDSNPIHRLDVSAISPDSRRSLPRFVSFPYQFPRAMKNPNVDLFDPRTIMDSESSPSGAAGASVSDSDFAFAFNDSNFSDRLLRIEIVADLPESKGDGEGCNSIADWARNRKRRREEIKKENGNRKLFLLGFVQCWLLMQGNQGFVWFVRKRRKMYLFYLNVVSGMLLFSRNIQGFILFSLCWLSERGNLDSMRELVVFGSVDQVSVFSYGKQGKF